MLLYASLRRSIWVDQVDYSRTVNFPDGFWTSCRRQGSRNNHANGSVARIPLLAVSIEQEDCSAPLKSSHLSDLLRPILDRASIAQRLMRALFVVPP